MFFKLRGQISAFLLRQFPQRLLPYVPHVQEEAKPKPGDKGARYKGKKNGECSWILRRFSCEEDVRADRTANQIANRKLERHPSGAFPLARQVVRNP